MKIEILVLAILMSFGACTSHDIAENARQSKTIESFKEHLHAEMKFEAIEEAFGAPDNDLGSGIHIYVYKLDDASEIRIGYTDYILYARHVDQAGQLIEDLF